MYSPMGETEANHLCPTHSFSSPGAGAYTSQHPGVGGGGHGHQGEGEELEGGTEEEGLQHLITLLRGLPLLSGVGRG